MRDMVMWQFPAGFVYLKRAVDFWENGGRWDKEGGFDWFAKRNSPHDLRNALINGALTAFTLTEDGRLHPVPAWPWSGRTLWGEVYSTGLVNVDLELGRVAGYLCVKRQDIENLWGGAPSQKSPNEKIETATVEAVLAECPALGLVVQALADDIDRTSQKKVYAWLSQVGPARLKVEWPEGSSAFPSLVRQINGVIRLIDRRTTWIAPFPTDTHVADLAAFAPLLGAAVEVFRLCQSGAVGHGPTRIVQPTKVEAMLRERVAPVDDTRDARRLLSGIAKLAIPDDKVSGGGRDRATIA